MELKTLLGFAAHPTIFQCTDSSWKQREYWRWQGFYDSHLLDVEFFFFLLYSSLALLLYRRNQDVLDP